jgi:hypothetical protein
MTMAVLHPQRKIADVLLLLPNKNLAHLLHLNKRVLHRRRKNVLPPKKKR